LARLRKCVRRRAHGGVDSKVLLARPHVGAVAAHHERKIAEYAHVDRFARARPLIRREPLKIGIKENLQFELCTRRLERSRGSVPEGSVPLAPVASIISRVQRTEQRVLVEPPPLSSGED